MHGRFLVLIFSFVRVSPRLAGTVWTPNHTSTSSSSSNVVVGQSSTMKSTTKKSNTKRRPLCHGCDFPVRTCICPALLPPVPLQSLLHNCRIVVIQHPHEVRKKNRSLPLVELCLFGKKNNKKEENGGDAEEEKKEGNSSCSSRNNSDNNNESLAANNHLQTQHRIDDKSGLMNTTTKAVTKGETTDSNSSNNLSSQQNQQQPHSAAATDDFVMKTIIARRLGIYCDSDVMKRIHDPNEVVVLVFPHDKALDLEDGLRLAEKRCKSNINNNRNNNNIEVPGGECCSLKKKKKMTLIFIDATWKYDGMYRILF